MAEPASKSPLGIPVGPDKSTTVLSFSPLACAARALAGAATPEEVLQHVADAALAVTMADGAFVERVISGTRTVQVAASAGKGTPPLETRVPYPGSLTEEIIERGEPTALNQVDEVDRSVAPYLARHCDGCLVLAAPMLSEGELLGALILLRAPGASDFREEDLSNARILADLAAVSLRRVTLLAEEQRNRADAERAVRIRDDVLGIVSHDLRNPLNTIMLSSSLMLEQPLSEDQRVKQIEIVKRAAERMNRLIQDLLDVARMEAGKLAMNRSPQPAAPLALEAVEAQRGLAEKHSIALKSEVARDLPQVEADRDRLLQVFANLIGNAIKFTRAGGVITVRAESSDGEVVFSVEDTGVGIRQEDIPCLFDAYWQATRTAHLGAGLGLSISKGIVEAHGGRIWTESELEKGSAFHFAIPIAR
ncbi:MAG: HAMP domain-containing histidine kinase [Gemmatimonadetes bacterium]|nr:HAMP domain-containing histidine kinase [Gemmatimonadota bacterium]